MVNSSNLRSKRVYINSGLHPDSVFQPDVKKAKFPHRVVGKLTEVKGTAENPYYALF